MEKNMDSSAIESKDADYETVYVISEEELINSFNSENLDKEIIIDGSVVIVEENSFNVDGQDIQLQDKENIRDRNDLMPIVSEKNDSDTGNNSGNVHGCLINNVNGNEGVVVEGENLYMDKNQRTSINHEQNILIDHCQNSGMDIEENLFLDSVEDSSIVHHQEKVNVPGKNCVSSVSRHTLNVKLQPSDWDKLTCPYCMKDFSKAYLMKRHMVTIHKFLPSEAPFPCFYCNQLCQQEDLLLKHYENEHKHRQQTAFLMARIHTADPYKFACPYCPKTCAQIKHLKKHLTMKHKFTTTEVKFPCCFKSCKMSFDKQGLLLKHYEREHNQKKQTALESTKNNDNDLPSEGASGNEDEIEIEPHVESRIDEIKSSETNSASKRNICRIKCVECDINYRSFKTFRAHLLKYHKLDVSEKEIRFPNMTAFKKWKLEIERRDLTFFTCQHGGKKLQNHIRRQYCCHRSGYHKYGNSAKKNKMNNTLGTSKTGFFCTATMTVREYPDEVHVKYCLQHYGHGGGKTFVNLSEEEQAAIQENLYNGIPLEGQLNDMKSTQSSAEHFQALIKKKRDISFLNKAYASEVYHSGMSSSEYVEQWVRICSEMEDSPILLYRHEASGTKSEDLMLIIMTEFQKHILITSTKLVVCLAYPSRIKRGHNLLTALIIIDDQDTAFPVAFCISSKVNKSSMVEFLSSVRESTGPLSCSYFMSNDYKFFYEAWQEVMQDKSKWVWSTWAFDDRIRKLFWQPKIGIKDINTREATYQLFRKIIECNSQPVFATLFKNFKNSLLDNPLTNNFGEYFVSQYDSNSEMWACCYRKDVKLSNNIFIEFLYKTLSYCVKITKTKQLDKLLMVLMKWLRYKMLDRLSNMLDEDKIDMVKNTISMCHNKGLEIECENVVSLSDKIWLIQSQNEAEVYVTQEYESCPDLCDLRCFDCDVCVHMYSCSCVQSLVYANMCQHIHAVVWKFITPHFSPPASPGAEPCNNVDDIDADIQIIPDKEPDILKSVLKRMQGVYKQVRINKCKLNKKSLVEVLKLLNQCYQISSSDEDYSLSVEKSTQTECLSGSKIVKSVQTDYSSESVIGKSSNHVLKGLDNISISYPSSIPVMAFDTVMNPVNRSCNWKLNSTSVSTPLPKSVLESRTNLNNSRLGSSFDSDQTNLLHATTNILPSPINTQRSINTPQDQFLQNRPSYAIRNLNGSNFLQVISPNNSSDEVNKISIIPIVPSKSASNGKPGTKENHCERRNVSDVLLLKDSFNISNSPVLSCPAMLKIPASSAKNVPVSAKTASDSFSNGSPVSKKRPIEKTSFSNFPVMKDSSNVCDNSVINCPSVLKIPTSSAKNLLPVSAETVPDSFSNSEPVAKKRHIYAKSMPLTKDSSNDSNSYLKNSFLSKNTVSTSGNLSVDAVSNSISQTSSVMKDSAVTSSEIFYVAVPNASVDTQSNLNSQTFSDVKSTVSSANKIFYFAAPNSSINSGSNSSSQIFSNVKSTATSANKIFYVAAPNDSVNTGSNSISKTSSDVKSIAAPSNEIFYVAAPNASVNTLPNTLSQMSSDMKSTAPSTNEIFYVAAPNASVNTGSNSSSQTSSEVKSTSETTSEILYVALPDASACTSFNSFSQKHFVGKSTDTLASVSNDCSKVTTCSAGLIALSDVSATTMPNSGLEAPSVLKSPSMSVSVLNKHSDITTLSSDPVLPVSLPVTRSNDVLLISRASVISSINTSDISKKINQMPIMSVDPVPNSISSCSPNAKGFHREINNSSNELLIKDLSNVSSGPVTNSPFIVKATVSTSDNLPAISASNSVSQGSSKIQPFVTSSSTTNDNSDVGTSFNDKVCFEKTSDQISNTSDILLDATSSVQSCQKESDVSCIITSCYSIEPFSNPVINSTAENFETIKSSQTPTSIPINQPGSLQYMYEPVSKKRYVVKARIPFTPKSSQISTSSTYVMPGT